jgi:hypothetical protein
MESSLFPQDIWILIIDCMTKWTYEQFQKLEWVSKLFYNQLNRKKIYLYGLHKQHGIIQMTTNKEIAFYANDCASVYLHLFPKVEKRNKMTFYRIEYHNFHPKLPKAIARHHDHDISKLSFYPNMYNSRKLSAKLYTKYNVTINNIKEIHKEYFNCIDQNIYEHERKVTMMYNLFNFWKFHDKLFDIFKAPNKQGAIIKFRYPKHYVIFNDLYKDKCQDLYYTCPNSDEEYLDDISTSKEDENTSESDISSEEEYL